MSDDLSTLNQGPQSGSNLSATNIQPLGQIFLDARKAKNLTQQDVSSQLRLSLKQIEALESDDFSALPMPMITRGFIRNYARLLGLDAEPLLLCYRARVPEGLPNSISVQSSLHQIVTSPKNRSWDGVDASNKLKYGLFLAVVIVLLIWLFILPMQAPRVEQSNANNVVEEKVLVTPTEQEATLPEVALPAAERQEEAIDTTAPDTATSSVQTTSDQSLAEVKPTGDLNNEGTAKTNATTVKTASATVDVSAVKSALPSISVETKPVKPVEVQISKKARIFSTERSWVSVKDKTGKVVFERMLVPDTEYGFAGTAPFNVVIGNAKATKLFYLGKPVDLSVTAENNIAHPVLE